MAISEEEVESILADSTKHIAGDIVWTDDVDHSPAKEFRVEVQTDTEFPLFVAGRFNPFSGKLTFAFILRGTGRVYALDLGKDHRNPQGVRIGEKHKHRWMDGFRDTSAYVPVDITETWDRPLAVWVQFCAEARLRHDGMMHAPQLQDELPL